MGHGSHAGVLMTMASVFLRLGPRMKKNFSNISYGLRLSLI